MKYKLLTLAILTLAFSLTTKLFGQVTIGSAKKPVAGALLELTQGTTTTKGMMLPRVKLTKKVPDSGDGLETTIEGADNGVSWSLGDHIGLSVYNTNIKGKCNSNFVIPVADPHWIADLNQGIYIWDGTAWTSIFENEDNEAQDVRELIDNGVNQITMNYKDESETYYYGDFGSAGIWMTQNLRTRYASDGTPLTASANQSWTGLDGGGNIQLLYAYPGGLDGTDRIFYDKNEMNGKRIGLLYDFYTAVEFKNCFRNLNGVLSQVQEGSLSSGSAPGVNEVESFEKKGYIKGICPKGWHLPSDREWNALLKELTINADRYATGSYSASDKTWNDIWETQIGIPGGLLDGVPDGNIVSKVMRSSQSVEDNPETFYPQYSESKPADQGGFDAMLVGYGAQGWVSYYGEIAYFWSSSTDYSGSDAFSRVIMNNTTSVAKSLYYSPWFYSVRCKKNN